MIWAILPDASRTETLLNNLSEAEFDLNAVSVMMQDMEQRNAIAGDLGPLKGVELKKLEKILIKLGLSEEGAGNCHAAVTNGKVLVVMNVDEKLRSVAEEMLQDHSAQLIKG